jgi:hypothetical protein
MSKLSAWKIVCIAVAGVTLSLLAANVVGADSFSDQAAKLDIVGVHLGMSPDQVKNVLSQYRKDMAWLESKDKLEEDSFRVITSAVWNAWGNPAKGAQENVGVVFSVGSGDPRVVAVNRSVGWNPQSQPPLVETVANSLIGKFGKPSDQSPDDPNRQTYFWGWDKAGRQISKPGLRSICDVAADFTRVRQTLTASQASKLENESACAIAMTASVASDHNNRIANHFEITLVDLQDGMQSAIVADNHAKQVEQAARAQELKNASTVKAPAL